MKLRESQDHPWAFVTVLLGVVLFGAIAAWASFRIGGAWRLLGVAALVGEALVIYGMFIEPQRLTVKRYREALRSHPETWMRVVLLCDFHAGSHHPEGWWERIALETQALAPDLLILGGDFVIDFAEPVRDLQPLGKLHATLGKYFVLGNHDHEDRPQDVRSAIRSLGYEDLTNRNVMLKHEGRELELQGLDDHWFGKLHAFKRRSAQIAHLLVSHEPDVLLDLQAGDTDLVLSGHTHGGQIRFPLLGALWVPSKLGAAVDLGRKIRNGVTCIISGGLGQSKWEPRLFSPPQIVVVEIGL